MNSTYAHEIDIMLNYMKFMISEMEHFYSSDLTLINRVIETEQYCIENK